LRLGIEGYPKRWIGKVTVITTDKAFRVASFSGDATPEAIRCAVDALWQVAQWQKVATLQK